MSKLTSENITKDQLRAESSKKKKTKKNNKTYLTLLHTGTHRWAHSCWIQTENIPATFHVAK